MLMTWVCFLGMTAISAHADVFSNVPQASGYNVAYELDIPVNGAFQGTTPVPYSVNNSATAAPTGFDRVAYYLEITNASGTKWAFASMDAFTNSVVQTGLPHAVDNPVSFQQSVSNLYVFSNMAGVQNGSFDRGQIEFWHHSYSAPNGTAVFASSSATLYDWGDTITTASPSGYGSFQIHNPGSRQVVLAYNRWASTTTNDDVGIGNSTGTNQDYTFAANTAAYTARKLVVLVRPKRFTVSFTAVPINQQVTPRNVASNTAIIPVAGTESTGGFEKAVLRVFRNGVLYGEEIQQNLAYAGGSASFSFSPTIPAELASYSFEIYLKQGVNLFLVRNISDITAGDVYLWYGQSNSEAAVRSGSANAYASPWIRTFGMSSDDATVTQAYPFWVQADGDGSRAVPAGVGQWALVVGRKIVDTYGIPVAILNGSRGGYSMPKLQRDDANLNNLADDASVFRVYNRLRYRANLAKVANGVRGIFYYQGESEVNNTAQHISGFASLMADWQVDYPAVERIFVTQLHVGCSTTRELPELRDAQRLLPDYYDKVRVMSSNGLTVHTDNCHYPFAGGYETHGLNSFRQVARDLYGAPDATAIDPPNPARVEVADQAGTRLRIVLRKPNAGITVDASALVDFRLTGSSAVLQSASVNATAIELQYDRNLSGATRLDYLAHIGSAGGWVRNSNGVGLLTFSEPVPIIVNDRPEVSIISPAAVAEFAPGTVLPLSATATTQIGTLTQLEIFIDGILQTAVGSGNAIADTWTVPASGSHQIVFRATNSGGKTSEASVVIFAGTTASPGGVSSGLSVWLKPESGIIRDSAGVVSSWQDSSGNGNHCSQATATAKPSYAPGSFGTMPGVYFDGADNLSGTAGMSTGSYTKIVRVSLPDFPATSGNILSSGGTTGTRHALYMASTAFPRLWHSAQFVVSTTAMVAGQGHLLVGTYDWTTKTGTLYLDGTQVGTGTATADNTDPTYQLGGLAGGNFMRGTIGEAIIYNRVLDSTERDSVLSYLNAKNVSPSAVLLDYQTWSGNVIAPGSDANPGGDANGNGIANLIEFALGLSSGSNVAPVTLHVLDQLGSVGVSYSRPTNRAGLVYQLLESTNMKDWTPVTDSRVTVSAGIEQRRYSRAAPSTGKVFYQLRVTLAP